MWVVVTVGRPVPGISFGAPTENAMNGSTVDIIRDLERRRLEALTTRDMALARSLAR